MTKTVRHYTDQDGNKFPLTEAQYDIAFRMYKSDRRRAVESDPSACLLALGVLRNRNTLSAYIGSGGDAYVVFKETNEQPAHAVHFKVKAAARKIINDFDTKKGAPPTQVVTLSRPPISWTLDHRDNSNARRRKEIKAGAPVNKRNGPPRKTRIVKIGIHPRRRAKITKSGDINLAEKS